MRFIGFGKLNSVYVSCSKCTECSSVTSFEIEEIKKSTLRRSKVRPHCKTNDAMALLV